MGKPANEPVFIKTPAGEELVILARKAYDTLTARAHGAGTAETDEDAGTARIIAETDAAIASGEDIALPAEVWEAIEAGENPVKVLRKHRGLTQAAVAAAAGISQAYVAAIEKGEKTGTAKVLSAIAKALGVPLDVLVE